MSDIKLTKCIRCKRTGNAARCVLVDDRTMCADCALDYYKVEIPCPTKGTTKRTKSVTSAVR